MHHIVEILLLSNRCTILGSPASAKNLSSDDEQETEEYDRGLDTKGDSSSRFGNPLNITLVFNESTWEGESNLGLEICNTESTSCSPEVDPGT